MTTNNDTRKPIPGAAIGIAVVLFPLCSVFFSWLFGQQEQNPPPLPVRIMVGMLISALLTGYVLLASYVFRDAKRRGMRHVMWTFIVVLVPNAIGFILYFLLRQPLLGKCPNCQITVKPDFNYCPRCHQQLKPVCPGCGKTAEAGSQFCPYCGTGLSPSAPAAAPGV
jgi:RNA polymerase subunit RPABC4/transcription elongation factor Spt4